MNSRIARPRRGQTAHRFHFPAHPDQQQLHIQVPPNQLVHGVDGGSVILPGDEFADVGQNQSPRRQTQRLAHFRAVGLVLRIVGDVLDAIVDDLGRGAVAGGKMRRPGRPRDEEHRIVLAEESDQAAAESSLQRSTDGVNPEDHPDAAPAGRPFRAEVGLERRGDDDVDPALFDQPTEPLRRQPISPVSDAARFDVQCGKGLLHLPRRLVEAGDVKLDILRVGTPGQIEQASRHAAVVRQVAVQEKHPQRPRTQRRGRRGQCLRRRRFAGPTWETVASIASTHIEVFAKKTNNMRSLRRPSAP